jgi:hypothetical protein
MIPVNDCANAFRELLADPENALLIENAKIAYARVDWMESEIDPASIDFAYAECIFHLGKFLGFKEFEEMTETELEELGI